VLTGRAWCLLFFAVLLLTLGLTTGYAILTFPGLVLILWLTGEGLLFAFQARWVVRGLRLEREIHDDRGPVASLWAGRSFEVRDTLSLDSWFALSYIAFEEPALFGLDVVEGSPRGEGRIDRNNPLQARFKIRAPRAGAVRLEGVKIRMADLHGLFHHVAFVRLATLWRVLPPLVDAEGKTATAKRFNLLPPPGIHRLLRPGSGSELLDLRDYMPGDPPKTIAWKVSARRDRLITKEYESEVPIRCTLFVDISRSVRLGPPGRNALTRLVEIAAGVAQANLANRDLTGLCLFDEEQTRILKPARNRRHLVQVFNELADAAGQPAGGGSAPVEPLLPLAYSFAEEVYPEELARGVNHVPGWLPWLVAIPSHWVKRVSPLGRLYRWFVLPLVSLIYLLIAMVIEGELSNIYDDIPQGYREEILPEYDSFWWAFVILVCLIFPVWLLLWRDALPLAFSPSRRRMTRMRKKMAALLASRYDLGAGGLELLLEDDAQLGVHLERFLNEHYIPHVPQLYDRAGRYQFAAKEKIGRLTSALLRAVGKGHDNELFVLLVDLVELEDELEPLVRAVKVALARHHQVMLIIPWPPDLELPRRDEEHWTRRKRPRYGQMSSTYLKEHLRILTTRHYHKSFHRARRTFARLQVPVLCAADADPIPLILERVDRLRLVHRRKR
jgi:uncharacterized protein (DUF58 family)